MTDHSDYAMAQYRAAKERYKAGQRACEKGHWFIGCVALLAGFAVGWLAARWFA